MKWQKKWLFLWTLCLLSVSMIFSVWANESTRSSSGELQETGLISSFVSYGENGNYEALDEYEVAYGTALDDVTGKLPATLTAKLVTGEEVEIPVTWRCISDGVGGTGYLPEHDDVTASYTFEAQLSDTYQMAEQVPDDYVMPFVTVRYTEDAVTLNSTEAQNGDMDTDLINDQSQNQSSWWTWLIWIIVIIVIALILWWLFTGNKNNQKGQ